MNTEQNGTDFPKAGFARLIGSFENTDDIVKLTRAFGLASRIHKGQLFRSEPYINHLLRVAMILVDELQMRDSELASAALLHDASEASDEELRECGDRAYSIARGIVEPTGKAEEREKALEEYFKKMAHAPKDARYVKIADKLDTLRSMKGQSLKAAKYKEEMENYVIPLANATDDRLAFKLSLAIYELK